MLAGEDQFHVFGERTSFALEVHHVPGKEHDAEPEDSKGSWGKWRLWAADENLCRLRLKTPDGPVEIDEVQWFLAPLFRWVIGNWVPLLHEKRLPHGDSRSRSARAAYLSMLESAGDDLDRFTPWQYWARRHSLRAASDGGIVPDLFIQRICDSLEFSWGDRIQPGADDAIFVMENGVARVSVDAVAESLYSAVNWFLQEHEKNSTAWAEELRLQWAQTIRESTMTSMLSWYLDSSPQPGSLTDKFQAATEKLRKSLESVNSSQSAKTPWLGNLSPEIAMFGDLSPDISPDAAVTLLAEFFNAQADGVDEGLLSSLVSDRPAWTTVSPWDNGYSLALDVLDQADPAPDAPCTRIESMLHHLGIRACDVSLGEQGPRGVALAGGSLRPTILVNSDNVRNSPRGRRFTLAHELCHILFDRSRARPLAHSSTPWASSSIEQRANAFAAMLLMPPWRAELRSVKDRSSLKEAVGRLADRLKVSRASLRQHLANIHEISESDLEFLQGTQPQGFHEEVR